MTKDDVLRGLARAGLRDHRDKQSVLACMMVLHTCDFVLGDSVLIDGSDVSDDALGQLRAVTRRHAAELVAEVVHRGDVEQGQIEWYVAYCKEMPFETFEAIPAEWRDAVQRVLNAMLGCGFVAAIVPAE